MRCTLQEFELREPQREQLRLWLSDGDWDTDWLAIDKTNGGAPASFIAQVPRSAAPPPPLSRHFGSLITS